MDGNDWFHERRRASLFVWTCPVCGITGIGDEYRVAHVTECICKNK